MLHLLGYPSLPAPTHPFTPPTPTPTTPPAHPVSRSRLWVSVDWQVWGCYCLLSRLPFFDLHFQVLWDLLAAERITRMQVKPREAV